MCPLQGLESTMQKTLVKVKTLITRNNQPSDKPPVHSSDPALQLMENVAEFSKVRPPSSSRRLPAAMKAPRV